ncbi:MAG: hypothetical protein VX705_03210 [Verrucomicrobiota bacterium]|nr:hypothetical protein [Verrucomicrobiota bacterium]
MKSKTPDVPLLFSSETSGCPFFFAARVGFEATFFVVDLAFFSVAVLDDCFAVAFLDDAFFAVAFFGATFTAFLADATFLADLAFGADFFGLDFPLETWVFLAVFFFTFGIFSPVNSKKAVKYGGEPAQSQAAWSTFLTFISQVPTCLRRFW